MSVLSAVRRRPARAVVLTAVAVLVAACGQKEAAEPHAEAPPATVSAPVAAAPADQGPAAYAAALEPRALILESLGCYRALNAARVDLVRERLSPELQASLSQPETARLLTLTTKAHRLDIKGQEQQAANSAGRNSPSYREPLPDDYEDYIRRCQAVVARAMTIEVG